MIIDIITIINNNDDNNNNVNKNDDNVNYININIYIYIYIYCCAITSGSGMCSDCPFGSLCKVLVLMQEYSAATLPHVAAMHR